MLEFGEKLTLAASTMAEADINALRQGGFTDREILSIVLAAAYRNFITRVADGLGVELPKTGRFAGQIIEAFGVSEEQAYETLYSDRLTARVDTPSTSYGSREMPRTVKSDVAVCWLGTQPPAPEAERFAKVKAEWEQLTLPHPQVNLAFAFAQRPEALEATMDFGRQLGIGGSGLGRRLEALIGLVVANSLWVPYLGVHHAQAFLEADGTPRELEALIADTTDGKLSRPEAQVVRFCQQLTYEPGVVGRPDLDNLRAEGFSDTDILTVVASTSYENFLCRVAAGLGVQLEPAEFSQPAFEAFA